MALLGIIFSLFLLFPNLSYSRCVFLPDAQWDIPNVSIDSSLCEQTGYTYYASGTCPEYHNQDTCVFSDMYLNCNAEGWCRDNAYTITSCSSPKVVNTQCPNGLSLYKYCVCPSEYKYSCTGTGYSGGSGTSCDGKYTSCTCASGYEWDGNACVCNSEFQYSCSGTGYNSGSGEACSGKYKSCDCSPAYTWSGSSCAYCGSEYKYACTSGSNVTGGSGTACGERYTACKCASGYTWSDGSCVATCNSSSSNWCSVHSSCHGDCCSDGTYESCDTRCGGSGCCKYVYYDGHKKKYNCSCYNDPGAGWCHIADVDIECWDDSGNIVATRTTNSSHGCVGSEARCLENNCSDEGVWIEGRKLCSVKVCD